LDTTNWNRVPVSEGCRSFAFNASLEDGISSADLGPTIIWDCVLVLVSIFVATLPAVAKMIERGLNWFQPHQALDLEMQTLSRYGASQQQITVDSKSSVRSGHSSPSRPPMLQRPTPAYQGRRDDLARSSAGGVSSYHPEEHVLYHAI
jgi:hypothetical protein